MDTLLRRWADLLAAGIVPGPRDRDDVVAATDRPPDHHHAPQYETTLRHRGRLAVGERAWLPNTPALDRIDLDRGPREVNVHGDVP